MYKILHLVVVLFLSLASHKKVPLFPPCNQAYNQVYNHNHKRYNVQPYPKAPEPARLSQNPLAHGGRESLTTMSRCDELRRELEGRLGRMHQRDGVRHA